MSVEERDPHTGYLTTGHEWNGIKELNTPVPRAVYFFLIATALFSLGYWILMPAWPFGSGYTKGVLGIDQRQIVSQSIVEAARDRATWTTRIQQASFADIQADPALMMVVRETGPRLFGDNCAACHGADARGNKGFPNLTTNSWLWGGSPEAIAETIRVGINSAHPDSRVSQMLAFGRDGMLQRPDIENVVAYVRSLSHADLATDKTVADRIAAGNTVFANNCASCHGPDGKGDPSVGAPNLTDAFWIYGGDEQTVFDTVWGGRQGHMPTWEDRLSEVDRKILTLYLVDQRMAQ
ncbi:MAG: cytochrome-c oxidase, cbb3-type subunit III [Rhodospirillaceae bacterium]|nr:MAG: cytochrome-c oxidase, cbb3-type subunit III [Rhodospirillaceae bacterium]